MLLTELPPLLTGGQLGTSGKKGVTSFRVACTSLLVPLMVTGEGKAGVVYTSSSTWLVDVAITM